MVRGVDIESKSPRKCLDDLSGWVDVAALLEAQVVRGADVCERRHLLATQTRHAAARASNEPAVFGTELLASRT
jgi:hypothetical protein